MGSAVSKLWVVADAAANVGNARRSDAGSVLGEAVGWVLLRLLRGMYLRMELREPCALLPDLF